MALPYPRRPVHTSLLTPLRPQASRFRPRRISVYPRATSKDHGVSAPPSIAITLRFSIGWCQAGCTLLRALAAVVPVRALLHIHRRHPHVRIKRHPQPRYHPRDPHLWMSVMTTDEMLGEECYIMRPHRLDEHETKPSLPLIGLLESQGIPNRARRRL
jgi:hypothetical protein